MSQQWVKLMSCGSPASIPEFSHKSLCFNQTQLYSLEWTGRTNRTGEEADPGCIQASAKFGVEGSPLHQTADRVSYLGKVVCQVYQGSGRSDGSETDRVAIRQETHCTVSTLYQSWAGACPDWVQVLGWEGVGWFGWSRLSIVVTLSAGTILGSR